MKNKTLKHLMLSLVLLLCLKKNKKKTGFLKIDQKIFNVLVVWKFMCCPRNRCRICQHARVAACTAQVEPTFLFDAFASMNCVNLSSHCLPDDSRFAVRNNFAVLSLSPSLPPTFLLSPYVWGELYVFVEWAGCNFYAFGLQRNENEIMNMLTFQCFLSKSNMY